MNVLFYYESLTIGGQQTQTLNLIKQLSGRHQVFFVFNQDGELRPDFEKECKVYDLNVPINKPTLRSMAYTLVGSVRSLKRIVRENDIEVVISASGFGSVISGIVARSNSIKHLRLLGCSLKQIEKRLYNNYRRFKIDLLIDKYVGVYPIFQELEEKGVSVSKFVFLPIAVDTEIFKPFELNERLKIRKELGIKDDTLVLGWVGRIVSNKEIKNSVALLSKLVNEGHKSIRLLTVGGGDWEKQMLEKFRELKLEDYVIHVGWQPIEKVPYYFAAMDVIPFLSADPIGGSILREGMATGNVVLTVNGASGGQLEWIEHEVNGLLVSPDNYMQEGFDWCINLQQDHELRKRISHGAITYAQTKMDFSVQAEALENAFLN